MARACAARRRRGSRSEIRVLIGPVPVLCVGEDRLLALLQLVRVAVGTREEDVAAADTFWCSPGTSRDHSLLPGALFRNIAALPGAP